MAQTISIPGRRIQTGETFYTDWGARGGDCIILRVQVLVAAPASSTVAFSLETRGENGTTVTAITPTTTAISTNSTGVKTCLYLATASTSAGNGAQEQVRVKVTCTAGTGYFVVRIFPLVFFDSAKSY